MTAPGIPGPTGTLAAFSLLAEAAPDAMLVADASGRLLLANSHAERLFGYAPGELAGQPVEALLPERFRGRHADHRARYHADPRARPMGAPLALFGQRKDGTTFPTEISLSPLETEDGTLVIAAVRDISERKAAEEALRLSEERFRLLVESVKEYAIYRLDAEGRVASWNAGAERLEGYKATEILGRHFSGSYPPEDAAEGNPARALRAAAETGQHHDEGWRIRKDGSRFRADVTLTALRDAEGRLTGFSKVTRDVTERYRAEQALHESYNLLQAVIEGTTDAVFVKDAGGRYRMVNRAGARLVGRTPEEVLGKDDRELFSPDTAAAIMEGDRRVMEAGTTQTYEETGTAAGTTRVYLSTKGPLRDAEGNVVGLVGISRDITERKQAEEERRALLGQEQAARAEAERAVRAREELLAVVSHDLQNGVNALALNAQLLLRTPPTTDAERRMHRYGVIVQQSVGAMNRLIRDLLDAGRIEAGRFAIDRQAHPFGAVVRDALAPLEAVAAEKSIRIDLRLDGGETPVPCDQERLAQVLQNLVGNAVKFTPAEGVVSVDARSGDSELTVRVTDNGPGILPEHLGYVFDRYWQADGVARRRGSGLGLFIVKGIVEAHGGKIWVESPPEGGASFVFNLPLC